MKIRRLVRYLNFPNEKDVESTMDAADFFSNYHRKLRSHITSKIDATTSSLFTTNHTLLECLHTSDDQFTSQLPDYHGRHPDTLDFIVQRSGSRSSR